MDEREEHIRRRAHRLWEEEGRPEGRAEQHWFQAKEMLAVEEGEMPTSPVAEPSPEPIEALVNAGEFPTLTDQGEMEIPHRPQAEAAPAVAAPKPAARGGGRAPGAKSAAKAAKPPALG
ncbi:DUF2934 domain-containing protein [Ancylobacter oerskovii]|uniref:DUF2934 domain-containing protein n=1 Tax=Ancylobacter oerskovii TaxID=459519 RepID=A0ABW4Z2M4_9HYPH|nr:DUF2934 domain-containing protein [Ancylobacter oerskovii]MBS7544743.1 DUF2934 domain-containing protein [Ancylobacter oerskovii]